MTQRPIRIAQISDLHVFADPNRALLGVNTQESFDAVLKMVKDSIADTDIVILSGDLSQDGSAASYLRVADAVTTLDRPVYIFPGNHDNVEMMYSIYPRGRINIDRQLIIDNWNIIFLNSQIPGKVAGHLDEAELRFMERCLEACPNHHALVMFHHQPMPVGTEWLDRLGVDNAEEFWVRVRRYPQVKHVIFGHIHQEFEQEKYGIQCYAAPATCFQFKGMIKKFALDNVPPGYRWIHLFHDGRITSGVNRVPEYVGVFDRDATGY